MHLCDRSQKLRRWRVGFVAAIENIRRFATTAIAESGNAIAPAGLMLSRPTERGFSLLETLIAAGILLTLLAGLAQLVTWSVSQAQLAGHRSLALIVAQDKLETLRAASWTFDLDGVAVSGSELAVSPSGSLDTNIAGYVEHVDAAMLRRWAVTPIDMGTPDAIAITVCVFRAPAITVGRDGADACVSSARVRQP